MTRQTTIVVIGALRVNNPMYRDIQTGLSEMEGLVCTYSNPKYFNAITSYHTCRKI